MQKNLCVWLQIGGKVYLNQNTKNLFSAYLRAASALVGLDKTQEAIKILKKGLKFTSGDDHNSLKLKIKEAKLSSKSLLTSVTGQGDILIENNYDISSKSSSSSPFFKCLILKNLLLI